MIVLLHCNTLDLNCLHYSGLLTNCASDLYRILNSISHRIAAGVYASRQYNWCCRMQVDKPSLWCEKLSNFDYLLSVLYYTYCYDSINDVDYLAVNSKYEMKANENLGLWHPVQCATVRPNRWPRTVLFWPSVLIASFGLTMSIVHRHLQWNLVQGEAGVVKTSSFV